MLWLWDHYLHMNHLSGCWCHGAYLKPGYHYTLSKGRLNIKMLSYQYKDSHVKDKTVSQTVLSLTWESPYLGKTVFILRWCPDGYEVMSYHEHIGEVFGSTAAQTADKFDLDPAWFILWSMKYINLHFQFRWRWRRWLTFFLVEDQDLFSPHSAYCGCWLYTCSTKCSKATTGIASAF